MDHHQRLNLAVEIAREAGRLTLDYFNRTGLAVERKADDSPVTAADRGAEQLLRDRIAAAFPDDAVLGEELADRSGTSGYRWILDPIDGTKSFIHGVPLYGTLIGVEHEGQCVIGVLRIPALGQSVHAMLGAGAWYTVDGSQPVPARVSECRSLAESLFLISELKCFDEVGRREAFERLQDATRLTRTWGDAYGYLLVATGRAELMIDPYLNPWDAAPMLPILTEAGGSFTDWQGNPTIHGGEAIGCCPGILPQVLEITLQFPRQALPI